MVDARTADGVDVMTPSSKSPSSKSVIEVDRETKKRIKYEAVARQITIPEMVRRVWNEYERRLESERQHRAASMEWMS